VAAQDRERNEQRILSAARAGHRKALQRLRDAKARAETTVQMVHAGAAEKVATRQRIMQELQASVAAVQQDMRDRADLYRCDGHIAPMRAHACALTG
jgi:3-deoxy-D-manno-octulosonate 8-phosphate phosphatase KdsC-like HAD superfamily phosphatase